MYQYPYGDLQQLNLDWIINKLKELWDKINSVDAEEVYQDLLIKDLAGGAIAHRGYGYNNNIIAGICQNTLKAYQLAHDNGFKVIEIDIMKDINGVICCFHDTSVNTLTDGTGYFKDNDYSTLHLKDGTDTQTNETIPTYDEVCKWAANNDAILEVEIKTGTNIDAVSVYEVVSIAEKYKTKIIINCQNNQSLLTEANNKYPNLWKNTNIYSGSITQAVIDNLYNSGYKKITLYTSQQPSVALDKYAYDHGYLIIYRVNTPYSNITAPAYGMTFSEGYRPNYLSPLVFDSEWRDLPLLNNFTAPSANYPFQIRREGNHVIINGVIQKTDFTSLPISLATRVMITRIPEGFRPDRRYRNIISIGEAFTGMGIFYVQQDGYTVLFRVDHNLSLAELNDSILQVFIDYYVPNPT